MQLLCRVEIQSIQRNGCRQFEKTRRDVNQWIRTQSVYDGYFDFDDILKNDTVPAYLKEEVHIGDGLHPNTMGGKILAECVDLSMLTGLDD